MTVVHIAPTPFFSDRGCHIRILGMLRGLEQHQVKSILCTYHHGDDVDDIDSRRIATIKNYTKTGAGPDPLKLWADVKLLWLSLKTIWREKPDLIHGHLHEGAMIGWACRWLLIWRRIPLFADIQGSLSGELETFDYFAGKPWLGKLFRFLESMIVRLPRALTCSSQSSHDQLQQLFNLSSDRLLLAEDGLDDKMQFAASRSVDEDVVTLLYSGSLLEGKGLNQLLQILSKTLDRHDRVQALIIGYPLEKARQWLESEGLVERCELTGRISYFELPNYLARADIALEPKIAASGEGSGKVINYMAAGLPVVGFDTVNNRGFFDDSSLLAPPHDIDTFADILGRLIDDPELRQQVGESNRQRVAQRYNWRDVGAQIKDFYLQQGSL